MVGPAFYIIGVLTFICVQYSLALTPEQATSVCALLPDGESIANPLDCSQFYMCSKGKAQLNSCLGNQLFSKDDQSCVPPDQSSCGADDEDPCAYMSDGYFVSVDNSCTDYYYCEDGRGQKGSCGNGLNFDQSSQSCKYPSEVPCTENIPGEGNINICQVVRSGIYFGYAQSCKAWQKCNSNRPAEIDDCPAPYYFNVDTQACDYKENVNCRQLQGNPGTGGPSLEGTPCDTNGEVQPDTTCSGYYVCTNGKYAFGKCINGQYFNPKTNKCASRLDAVNDCDRCEGSKMQFVNLYQDDCVGYAYCSNGKTQSTGRCASGYFSEVAGSCVQNGDNPEYPVCYIKEDEDNETTQASTTTDDKADTDPTPKTDAPKDTTTKTDAPKDTTTKTTKTTKSTKATKSTSTTTTTTTPEPEAGSEETAAPESGETDKETEAPESGEETKVTESGEEEEEETPSDD